MNSSLSGEIHEARLVPTFSLSGETSAVECQVQALPPTSLSGETLMVCETLPLPRQICENVFDFIAQWRDILEDFSVQTSEFSLEFPAVNYLCDKRN